MINSPHLFSFFSGVGFLDLGLEDAGFTSAFVNEFHKPFLDAYVYARERTGHSQPWYGYFEGSIERLLERRYGNFLRERIDSSRKKTQYVGFVAGPPCPDFSIGGKNRGENGENGRLSSAYTKLILNQKPDFFLFENVKGLWRTKKHREFYERLKSDLSRGGYVLADKLVNSISFGVPQDRDRIVLLGFKKTLVDKRKLDYNPATLHFENGAFPWKAYEIYDPQQILADNGWPEQSEFSEDSKLPEPGGVPINLTVESWFRRNNVNSHPNQKHHFVPRAGLAKMRRVPEGDVSKKSYKRLHRWRYSPTAAYGNNEVHLHPYKARRISAAEALAIQSLPKSFELPESMTLSNKFKSIGNGVPYLMSKSLGKSLLDFLET